MKRIGVFYPSCGFLEYEIQKILPDGVSLHVTRVPMKTAAYEYVLHMADNVEQAAILLADAKVDIIAFACTAGSFIKGAGYHHDYCSSSELEGFRHKEASLDNPLCRANE